MDSGFFFVVFLGFIAFAVVVALVGNHQAKKRREALMAFAASRGWTYLPQDESLVERFSGAPFGHGSSRRARNVLRGTHDGRPVVAFDYQYTTSSGSGKDRRTTTHHYSVVVMNIGAVVPRLAVSPQSMVSGFFGRVFNTDIELESEDFNRAFVVSADDRKFASDVLHPRMMEILLRWTDLGWRFERDSIISIRGGQHELAEVDAKLAHLDAVLDAVPDFVWRAVKGQT